MLNKIEGSLFYAPQAYRKQDVNSGTEQSYFQINTELEKSNLNTERPTFNSGFVNITLTTESFLNLFSQISDDTGGFGGNTNDDEAHNLLHDVDSFMSELSNFGYSENEINRLSKANEKFQKIANDIFAEADGHPLTEAQLDKLYDAEEEFFNVENEIFLSGLSPEQRKQFEQAEATYEKATSAIFDAAGENPLTIEQEKQLAKAEATFDKVLDSLFGPTLSEAQYNRQDASLEKIENTLQKFDLLSGKVTLNEKQENLLAKAFGNYDKTLDTVFAKNGIVTETQQKLLGSAEADFKTALNKIFNDKAST